jgi:hypothetical protein
MLNCYRKNSRIPGTHCWTEPAACKQNAQAARADQDGSCSGNVSELVQCSGRQHGDDGLLENLLLPLQSADDNMDSSLSTMTTLNDIGGDEDSLRFTVDQHGDGSTPDGIDSNMEEPTGLNISTDVSMGVEQPVVDDEQIRYVHWSLIPGFRFLPTDLELVLHWLKHKVLNFNLHDHNAVRDGVDVHRTNAEEITRKYKQLLNSNSAILLWNII